jgi:predicted pyridoxine 5'-phosphate oxidase superfamily flavin-nucleotide-binding protein
MSTLYTDAQRSTQNHYNTAKLAALLDQAIVHDALTPDDAAFIRAQNMFFLATVDAELRPTVSYKGGAPGFVHVDGTDILFPCYDGNGMFLSIGNITQNAEIGMLFIDFATPNRLRVQGTARIDEGPAKSAWPGAISAIRVTPTHVFVNCGRYIHRRLPAGASPHVPDHEGTQPVAAWKRIDIVQDSLPPPDRDAVSQAGTITMQDYAEKLARGES